MSALLEWLETNQTALLWFAGFSVFVFLGTLIAIPFLVIRMEPDYFLRRTPPPHSWRQQHPAVRVLLRVSKNALGYALVLSGAILSLPLIPGQGILTVLVGLSLIDFPGKRALELRLARLRPVLRAINWIRRKADRPPLELPPREDGP
jgi:hypothetical protein